MEKQYPKYFLAANSCEGFVSHFGDSFVPREGWRAIIIKGGPGTGKSSFMKYMVARAAEKGYRVDLCVCSSDPDSLDGVVIWDIKTVILDGTAPHIVEPKYPAACEEILNLGEFWNREKLFMKAQEIICVTDENKALHKTTKNYLAAAGQLLYDNLRLARRYTDQARAYAFGVRLARKLIPQSSQKQSREWVRFIGGITPKGVVGYKNTVNDFYKNKIIIEDKFGAASSCIMEKVREEALKKGYEIITLRNPFLPSQLIDHILIPELSLAFVTENEYINFGGSERRIHARRFADVAIMREYRGRMLFNRRIARELLLSAAATLKKAKAVHDKLEKYYVDAMDFDAIARLAPKIAEDILKNN